MSRYRLLDYFRNYECVNPLWLNSTSEHLYCKGGAPMRDEPSSLISAGGGKTWPLTLRAGIRCCLLQILQLPLRPLESLLCLEQLNTHTEAIIDPRMSAFWASASNTHTSSALGGDKADFKCYLERRITWCFCSCFWWLRASSLSFSTRSCLA